MSINTMGADLDGPQGHIKAIKDFARLLN
jgi:hypothetical protein